MSDEKKDDVGAVFGSDTQDDPTREAAKEAASKQATAGDKKTTAPTSGGKKKPATKKPPTVRIKLAHNKDIPPNGLHIGHNGRGYLLKPGIEVDVPEFLLDVLDNAVASKPVLDQGGRVKGYEEQPRFMYTIVRNKK